MTSIENINKNKNFLPRLLTWIAAGSVFLFPGLVATVDSAGSSLFVLLVLVGLVGFRGGWNALELWEKALLAGFMLFLAAAVLSLVNADDIRYGLRRLEKLVRLLALVPVYMTIRHWKIDLVRPFFYGCLLAGPLMLGISMYQSLGEEAARSSGAYHPIIFGDQAILIATILGASLLFPRWRRGVWPVTVFSLFCALAASAFSGSRGGWLALPPVLGLYLWSVRGSLKPGIKVLIAMVFLTMATVLTVSDNPIKNRIERAHSDIVQYQTQTGMNTSVGARFLMWEVAIDLWRENPILGTGLGDYRQDTQHAIDTGKTALHKAWQHAHSIYFEYLATTGLIGVLTMIGGLLVIPCLFFLREFKKDALSTRAFPAFAGLGCVLCFAIFGLSEAWTVRSTLLSSYIVTVLVFASGLFSRPHLDSV